MTFLVLLLFRLFVSMILIVAGWTKIQASDVFAKVILSFGIPSFINKPLAKILPWFEIVLGVLLGMGIWLRLTTTLATIFLLVFTVAISINLLRGNEIECGCFGSHSSKISWKLVTRNILLILLLGIVYTYK